MSDCSHCSGNCGSCGSKGELILSQPELDLLDRLRILPFLAVGRTEQDPTPHLAESPDAMTSLALMCLEKRGLILIDFDKPLPGDTSPYPIRGSIGLTERGIDVLEILDIQGITY